MSELRFLVLFPGDYPGWLRVGGDGVVARGDRLDDIPPPDPDGEGEEIVVLAAPGVDVVLHWVELPRDLSSAQLAGAARLSAADVSAAPIDRLHIAAGAQFEDSDDRCIAVVSSDLMAKWLAEMQAIGLDPDSVIPEPLLLSAPEAGVRVFARAGLDNVRGYERAFAAEPDLAALAIADDSVETLDIAAFEAGLPCALATAPVDLRRGAFAKRRRWTIDWPAIRRIIAYSAAILLITLLTQLIMIMQYSFGAGALEREAQVKAQQALPASTAIVDPAAQLRDRLNEVGGGPGYSEIAGAVFAAVRDTEGAELQSMLYTGGEGVQIDVAAADETQLSAFEQRLVAMGLSVTPGAPRNAGGKQVGSYTVRAS